MYLNSLIVRCERICTCGLRVFSRQLVRLNFDQTMNFFKRFRGKIACIDASTDCNTLNRFLSYRSMCDIGRAKFGFSKNVLGYLTTSNQLIFINFCDQNISSISLQYYFEEWPQFVIFS